MIKVEDISEDLSELQDSIFERLPNKEAKTWTYRFLNSIKKGSDLSMIYPKFILYLLEDNKHGVIQNVQEEEFKKKKEYIEKVIRFYRVWIETGIKPGFKEAHGAYAYAAADADSASNSAFYAIDTAVATYAYTVAYTVDSAAKSYSAAGYVSCTEMYKIYSEKLLSLLKEAGEEKNDFSATYAADAAADAACIERVERGYKND